jgi:hypothetical protein
MSEALCYIAEVTNTVWMMEHKEKLTMWSWHCMNVLKGVESLKMATYECLECDCLRGIQQVFMCVCVCSSLVSWHMLRLSPLGTSPAIWHIVPALDDDEGGVRIGRRKWSTHFVHLKSHMTWYGLEPGLATNCLSSGMAQCSLLL